MAAPLKDNVLTAKVSLKVYTDAECTRELSPVPPGRGYQKSYQYPGRKEAGQELGLYTGVSNGLAYQVNFVIQYRVVPKWPKKPYNVISNAELWVKKAEVTGMWDVDNVDSPKNDPNALANQPLPETNNTTNYLLGAGVLGALLLKYRN